MDVTQEQINALYDAEVKSVDGDRLGPVRQVYLDDETGAPTWITVRTGWFAGREHPVPLEGSEQTEDGIRVSASGPEIREAPTVEEDEHLGQDQLAELVRYYGLAAPTASEGAAEHGASAVHQEAGPSGRVRRHARDAGR
ncbi:PRC-barrel domain-containing protein [Ornithinimicrobium pekingense]|uniref:PRC-barrel domain-containing protein n=1 Tax=Ornithinimicrobium pekingense TaxID=384677 RepID=A0ABQ2F6T2_9MICO|nr:PRC-barrel domain-containing protein [Ornithinimicrobium pekingense]GGK67571.1 hypothetical protein GCM10011509_14940 [Ornithinimicrobium pekingense]